jgi:inorganic triphosphatase YgiF
MDSGLSDRVETEQKYEVSPDYAVPELRGLGGGLAVTEPETRLLDARYFDTNDHRLAAAGVTLRRRTGGPDEGWHLKLPVSADSRREVQVPLGESEETVPVRLASLVADLTGGEPLRIIATVETRRTVRRITGAAGEDLAEVADDQVTGRAWRRDAGDAADAGEGRDAGDAAGTRGTAAPAELTWREIEVELISGSTGLLSAVGARLLAAGARPSRSASKLARVLAAGDATGPPR